MQIINQRKDSFSRMRISCHKLFWFIWILNNAVFVAHRSMPQSCDHMVLRIMVLLSLNQFPNILWFEGLPHFELEWFQRLEVSNDIMNTGIQNFCSTTYFSSYFLIIFKQFASSLLFYHVLREFWVSEQGI